MSCCKRYNSSENTHMAGKTADMCNPACVVDVSQIETLPVMVGPGDACNELRFEDNPFELPLAVAYVRPQEYRGTLTPEESLRKGTCFPELVRPYIQDPRRWRA